MQCSLTGWKQLFEDPVIADAIEDRLTNPSQILQLKGISYRTKLNKENQKNMTLN